MYALRSYSYIIVHAIIGKIFSLAIWNDKIIVFYLIRGCLGILCAFSETVFYQGVTAKFGGRAGRYCLILMAANAGIYFSSTGEFIYICM